MASPIEVITQAKNDIIASGGQMLTDCDAYRIVNLAALRAGWKMVEKTGGVNCQGRKTDGIIPGDGYWYDGLISAGPPSNTNTPAWMQQGPVGNLVALDPFPDPLYGGTPVPPNPPDGGGNYDEQFAQLNQKMDHVIAQNEILGNMVREGDQEIHNHLNKIVEDMEETLKKMLPLIQNICKFDTEKRS